MHRECFPDYGWKVLKSIKDIFSTYDARLAGGTALALQIGHRISRDLDFFTLNKFRIESVISQIRKTGQPFTVITETEGTLIMEVGGIRLSLFRYEYNFIEKPVRIQGIQLAGVIDIASMKVIAINQRGSKRDFVDLYFVLQEIPFHKIAENMVKRFGAERINPVHIGKSLVYFSDADTNPEPAYIKGREVQWEHIRGFFRNHVRQFVLDLDAAVNSGGSP